jgi:ABC-2 type transport system permease protein
MTAAQMKSLRAVFAREMLSYATTPIAYVFTAVFLFAAGLFTFQVGRFFDLGRADLSSFFAFHPWLYIVFLPAIAMRLWAEDNRSGAVEILLTLPAPTWALVLGKFLAALAVAGIALVLTFPFWITVNVLGHPDNGAILVGYLASFLMAGSYLALGSAISATTETQVIAFVLSVLVCFAFTAVGSSVVLSFLSGQAGAETADALARLSILQHFEAAQRGVIELRALFYFLSLIAMALTWTVLAVDSRRGG